MTKQITLKRGKGVGHVKYCDSCQGVILDAPSKKTKHVISTSASGIGQLFAEANAQTLFSYPWLLEGGNNALLQPLLPTQKNSEFRLSYLTAWINWLGIYYTQGTFIHVHTKIQNTK